MNIYIQTDDFSLSALYEDLRQRHGAAIGAIAMFSGLVRELNEKAGSGSQVSALTLEHYPGMTEKSIEGIVSKAHERWPLLDVTVVHRVGTLQPAEQIVAVLAASAHRDAAFAAAEFIMDYLKTDAVFWKKESAVDGDTWVQTTDDDRARAGSWQSSKSPD